MIRSQVLYPLSYGRYLVFFNDEGSGFIQVPEKMRQLRRERTQLGFLRCGIFWTKPNQANLKIDSIPQGQKFHLVGSQDNVPMERCANNS